MAKKKVIVTRNGLTNCPSCMSHINLASELEQTECPFCHANLVIERRQDNGTFGRNTLQTLKKSRSAMLAAALGASLSMTACGEKDENNASDNNTVQPVYGAPLVDMGVDQGEVEDMNSGGALYGAPPVDMDTKDLDEDMPLVEPMYGGPPLDMEVDMKEDMDTAVPEYGAPLTDMG